MSAIPTNLRRQLENAIKQARKIAKGGARKALEALAVHEPDPYRHMDEAQRDLRRKLRAQAKQLGDGESQTRRGAYEIKHLVEKLAYDQWHRLLFARFLLENNLLISPEHGVSVSLDDCEELAPSVGLKDAWAVAARFAAKELPEIFRADDPAGAVELPVEDRKPLIHLVTGLPVETFTASDSLGWCYQFWQAERKVEINAAGNKIGADELPAVTQLFTEDYMVDFLLDNTLGSWHAGKVLAAKPMLAETAQSEEELRNAVALPGCPWMYLRFIKTEDGKWRPAAGMFDAWPKTAKELKCLDPCMGSGHFVVAIFERLVALRMAEEKLDESAAVPAVIRDNLFGLEIDPRCTQIGAFNLALAAWRRVGHCKLPAMNLACSGLAPNAKQEDWLKLTGKNEKLRNGMERLHRLFKDAPVLGSLINPRLSADDMYVADYHELQPLLETVLAEKTKDDTVHEMAVTARGLAKAAEILAGQFTLIATNVPYLGREGHTDELTKFADGYAPDASADLATLMLHRCLQFTGQTGTLGVVLPQNWWVGKSYSAFRKRVLVETAWRFAAVLGEEAWQAFGNRGPNTILLVLDGKKASDSHGFAALDVSTKPGAVVVGPETKARALAGQQESDDLQRLSKLIRVGQRQLYANREARISVAQVGSAAPLSGAVISGEGCSTGDNDRFLRCFWELSAFPDWLRYCGPGFEHWTFCDTSLVVFWEDGSGELAKSDQARIQNTELWHRSGVLVGRVRGITSTLFSGGCFSKGAVLVCPRDKSHYLPIYAFLKSKEFENLVRTIDPRVSAATSVLTDVPFDLAHWQKVAADKYPHGLPKPFSSDPTQWLFNGHPKGSDQQLHVAVARLLGYQWPRQTGSSFPDCPTLGPDGLQKLADQDGIVCLSATKGEAPASERLRALLLQALGKFDLGALIASAGPKGSKSETLEEWLRDEFFGKCCNFENGDGGRPERNWAAKSQAARSNSWSMN
ncbi:MAG TPA: SAM-dependent DNA methyltransferase [Terriglobales bacterium]